MENLTVNREQKLYVISNGVGYSTLGFDVAMNRAVAMVKWLNDETKLARHGSKKLYAQYCKLSKLVIDKCKETHTQCNVELSKQLIGLEGRRVEVVTTYGETRRFIVGKSTGFIPVHLEIKTKISIGGMPAEKIYKSVRVIG